MSDINCCIYSCCKTPWVVLLIFIQTTVCVWENLVKFCRSVLRSCSAVEHFIERRGLGDWHRLLRHVGACTAEANTGRSVV